MAPQPDAIARHFLAALAACRVCTEPFRHWLLRDVLPSETAEALTALPLPGAPLGETAGRREIHNATRIFLGTPSLDEPVCRAVAEAFRSPATIRALEDETGAALTGTSLRIEYCADAEGFWLEPHTDIGAKRFTMLIYLSSDANAETWGTDIYRSDGTHHSRAPSPFNSGLIFVPGSDTWHGFEPRQIVGIRRTLIVNYVGPEWRARHELAFPDQPIA